MALKTRKARLLYQDNYRDIVNFMAIRTSEREYADAGRLQIGKTTVDITVTGRELGTERKLAPLSEAKSIQKEGIYWISAEGVPKKDGFYIDNTDGTVKGLSEKGFVKVSEEDFYNKYEWSVRIYVSPEAAAKASRGKEPLALIVSGEDLNYSRLYVRALDRAGIIARVVSVPQAKEGSVEAQTEPFSNMQRQ